MKKLNLKKLKVKPPKFPSISRLITDLRFWLILVSLLVILAIGMEAVSLYFKVSQFKKVQKERQQVALELKYWEDVAKKHQDYRDAYFNLALLEYKLGDRGKASFYLQKVFSLDPNFEAGRELEKILN